MRRIILTFAIVLLAIYALQAMYYGGYDSRNARLLSNDPLIISALIDPVKKQGGNQAYVNAMLTLRAGGVPSQQTFELVDSLIDARYGAAPGQDGYTRSFTLLEHALEAENLEGVEALFKAGADPHTSANRFVEKAPMGDDGKPDWSAAGAFLGLYLSYNGNPNHQKSEDDLSLAALASQKRNFVGARMLITAGADFQPLFCAYIDECASFSENKYSFLTNDCLDTDCISFMIWLQREGYFEETPIEATTAIYDHYLDASEPVEAYGPLWSSVEIGLVRDFLAESIGRNVSHRFEHRKQKVVELSAYLDELASASP